MMKSKKIYLLAILIWSLLCFIYYISSDLSLSIRSHRHQDSMHLIQDTESSKEFIQGSFVAIDNNLGIITFELPAEYFDKDGKINFKLYEEETGKNILYKKIEYWRRDDKDMVLIGFDVQPNSKNLTYQFEVSDIQGLVDQELNHSIITKYKFDTTQLKHNPVDFIIFINKKLFYAIFVESTVWDVVLVTFLFIASLFGVFFLKNIKSHSHSTYLIVVNAFFLILILINSWYLEANSSIFDLLIILYYLFFIYHLKFSHKYEMYNAILLLFVIILGVVFKFKSYFVDNLSDWVFYLLAIGIFRALIENNVKKI